jgi:hypothetical protein
MSASGLRRCGWEDGAPGAATGRTGKPILLTASRPRDGRVAPGVAARRTDAKSRIREARLFVDRRGTRPASCSRTADSFRGRPRGRSVHPSPRASRSPRPTPARRAGGCGGRPAGPPLPRPPSAGRRPTRPSPSAPDRPRGEQPFQLGRPRWRTCALPHRSRGPRRPSSPDRVPLDVPEQGPQVRPASTGSALNRPWYSGPMPGFRWCARTRTACVWASHRRTRSPARRPGLHDEVPVVRHQAPSRAAGAAHGRGTRQHPLEREVVRVLPEQPEPDGPASPVIRARR